MCAIVGMIGNNRSEWAETYRLLTALLVAAQVRGRDATGFVAMTRPLKGKSPGTILLDKAPLPASDFVSHSAAWKRLASKRSNIVLGHCRFSTSGSPAHNINNHPHVSDDGRFALIHNGILPKHEAIADRHCLKLESDCDSEVLLRLIEAAPRPVDGLADCLRACGSVGGSMAVALLDTKTETVWLCRDSDRPLWLCRLKGQRPWFFASTAEILMTALEQTYGRNAGHRIETIIPLASGQPHAVTPTSGLLIATIAEPVRYRKLAD